MKLAAVLLSLVGLSACTFPDYDTDGPIQAGGNAGSVASAGNGATSASGGTTVIAAPSCSDGIVNADESDSDCGGESGCDRCTVGERCHSTSDCDGGLCASGQCRAPTCRDGLLNGDETDLDCGGDSCAPCAVGQACMETRDCDGVACRKRECQPASCDDEIWNQDESDLDCGSSCALQCEDDQRCKVSADCQSGVCSKSLRCAAPTCSDGVRNGDEPTEDCGGSCTTKCVVLDTCTNDDDCTDSSCIDQRCLPASATGKKLSPATWTAAASSTFVSSTTKSAIDGLAGTDWTSGADQELGMFFTIDMQTEQVFFSIEIDCLRTPADAPVSVDVSLSSDGVFSAPPVKANVPGSTQLVITFAKPQVARHLKLSLADVAPNHWWRIDEIRVKQ